MKQQTISDVEYSARKRKNKREKFLVIMDEIIPWEKWVDVLSERRTWLPSEGN